MIEKKQRKEDTLNPSAKWCPQASSSGGEAKKLFWSFVQCQGLGMTPCLSCLPLPADHSQGFSEVLFLGGWVSERWQHPLERRLLSQILGGTPRISSGFWKLLLTVSVFTPPAHCDRVPSS